MAQRTERIWLQNSFNLMQYSHQSKNLYNQANYVFKQQLQNKHYTSEYDLNGMLQYHPYYRDLPSQTSQQIIKFLVKSWKSFFEAIKVWKVFPDKFKSKPNPPKYKRRDGFHVLYFTSQQVNIKDGYIRFPKRIGLQVKTRLDVRIKHARIIPKGNSFLLEIVYDRETKLLRPINNIVAIDFGLDNLITAVSNNTTPIIIKGTPLKSYNQWFNKQKAKLTTIYASQQPGAKYLYYGKAMKHLIDKRYKKVEDYLHKVSKSFIDHCIKNDIDTVIVGYNEGWKQNIYMGKRNNQNFVNLPFLTLLRKIEYKAEDAGIRVIRQEESYTSKCSFLDNEEIGKHKSYKGKRLKRGLFRSSTGIEINADCNGAGNTGRKVFPKTFVKGIVDIVSYPICLSV